MNVGRSVQVHHMNKRFMKKKVEFFQPLMVAIDEFGENRNLLQLSEAIETSFGAWCTGDIPSLQQLETDKTTKKQFQDQITAFVNDLDDASRYHQEPLTPFWKKNLKSVLELMYMPTKKPFHRRLVQGISRWTSRWTSSKH